MPNSRKDIITENIDVHTYIKEYVKELKHKDIVVDSLEEALQLAGEYKRSRKYDWFRGQTGLWPLLSSANRLNDEERNEAEEKLKRFDNWSYANNLFKDFDSSEAIAQHHGLKTMFIDFTTDPKVAAFFASDEINYKGYEYSCIYCLNTEDFNDSLKDIKKFFPDLPDYPRLIDVDVDNLWRLEAQKGKFMYQPVVNLDWFYSLHRIVFKVKKNDIKLFDKSYIYPQVKSALEERLDGFILNEKTKENSEYLHNVIDKLKKTGAHIEILEVEDELYIEEFVIKDRLLKHKWEQKDLELWENRIIEKYKDIYTTEKFLFKIESFEKIDENKFIINEQLSKLLNENQDIRQKAIKFLILDNEKNIELIEKFEKYSNLIWNGMRKLPYENNDIAKVISDLIQILDISVFEYEKFDKDFLKIGFSDIVGAGNSAFVNENFLYEAMRDDLKDCIIEDTKDVRSIIYHIRDPQLLYKFEAFKKLFVDSIILSQVVYGGNDFVIFSPTEIKVFGLP